MTDALRRWRRFVLALGVLLAGAAGEAATVSGIVSDPTGSAVANARVVLRDIATGVEQETTTGADGRYRFDVENLTDRFYREHFQFAPARGRCVTVGFTLGAF